MPLQVRSSPYTVPTYSLTGDLLAYLSCGLQYRYHNRASLPPSKPVQLWFGQFIHGVMEEAYRAWNTVDAKERKSTSEWTEKEILPIIDLIIKRLSAQGLYFQHYQLLGISVERAFSSIRIWGPYLFPYIQEAEIRLRGIRPMPSKTKSVRQSNYYEIEGIADVLTSVSLRSAMSSNPIVDGLLGTLDSDEFEIIVDYKGMRRPSIHVGQNGSWEHQEWQIYTYAWLRLQQTRSDNVRCGIILYLNELTPSIEDMDHLYREVVLREGKTDLEPQKSDFTILQNWPVEKKKLVKDMADWREKMIEWWEHMQERGVADQYPSFPRIPSPPNILSEEYRLKRSLRLVTINKEGIGRSLNKFDKVIAKIENSVTKESLGKRIRTAWDPNPREETCTVCDFRKFCPADGNPYNGIPKAP